MRTSSPSKRPFFGWSWIEMIAWPPGLAIRRISAADGSAHRIALVSWRPYAELPSYLAAADICILPAHQVDLMQNIVPIKVYEYMAAGKPVIAARLPGLVREFGEGNGVVFISDPHEAVSTAREDSSAAYRLMKIPSWAPRPQATISAAGVARPSAHGHAMISTATAFRSA